MDYLKEFKKMIEDKIGEEANITRKSNLKDLGLDSLDLVEIILEAEEKFEITFENEELLEFETVGDVVKAAEEK